MYIFDFIKKLFRESNISALVYVFLNIALIAFIFSGLFSLDILTAVGTSLLVYIVSMIIALSPIGEFMLRLEIGAKKMKPADSYALMPLFDVVYRRAKVLNPELPDNIKLFVIEDPTANAFATGRKTICINRGLLNLPPTKIQAILAHEFAHLVNRDTDLLLLISVGNLVITTIIVVTRIVIWLILTILGISRIGSLLSVIFQLILIAVTGLFMWIWTRIGVLLVHKSSRENEFKADEYAHRLGYGLTLASALCEITKSSKKQGFFSALADTHPPTSERINRLQMLSQNNRLK